MAVEVQCCKASIRKPFAYVYLENGVVPIAFGKVGDVGHVCLVIVRCWKH